MTRQDLLVLPILLPLAGAILAAVWRGAGAAWVALIVALLTAVVDALLLHAALSHGPLVYRVGGWVPPYGIVLVADRFSSSLALLAACVATVSALHTIAAREAMLRRHLFHSLFLLMLTALGGVFFTGDLFNLYVFMELVILGSFALVALADEPVSAEATFKYAILASVGSAILLASVALTYAATGTLNMADIALRMRQAEPAPFWPIAAALMLCSFLLKGGIFPFHFWLPDAHSAAPAPMSAMLSGILVKIGFYGVARMVTLLFPDLPLFALLAPLGAMTALFGGLAALSNIQLKRTLAYSTIANMGFVLLALGWGGQAGLIAAFVNSVNHALIKSSLFLSGGYLVARLQEGDLTRLGGVARLTPSGTIAFGLGAMSLGGLPPLSGFLSKLTLLQAGWAARDIVLLTAALVASALSIGYSLRLFLLIFWGETPEWAARRWTETAGRAGTPIAPLALALLYLCLGLWPGPLLGLASAVATELRQPALYTTAVLGGAG